MGGMPTKWCSPARRRGSSKAAWLFISDVARNWQYRSALNEYAQTKEDMSNRFVPYIGIDNRLQTERLLGEDSPNPRGDGLLCYVIEGELTGSEIDLFYACGNSGCSGQQHATRYRAPAPTSGLQAEVQRLGCTMPLLVTSSSTTAATIGFGNGLLMGVVVLYRSGKVVCHSNGITGTSLQQD